MNLARFAAGAALALLLVPAAAAHGASPPPDEYKRELADCVDDWFGSDSEGSGGYDLHALDVREAWEPGLGNVLGLRLVLNGDGPVQIDIQPTVAGQVKHLRMSTVNGETWAKGDFARLAGPKPAVYQDGTRDGDRITIEGIVALSTLGVTVGDTIADFRVTSKVGSEDADAMPGYQTNSLFPGQCESGDGAPFNAQAAYRLRGPIQYTAMPDVDGNCVDDAGAWPTQTLPPGLEKFVDIWVCNKLRDQAQEFTLTAAPRDGFALRFHEPGTGAYSPAATFAVRPNRAVLVHLAVTAASGTGGSSGDFAVTLDTDLGGHVERAVPYEVRAGATSAPSTSPANGSPQAGLLWLGAIALVGAALLRRR